MKTFKPLYVIISLLLSSLLIGCADQKTSVAQYQNGDNGHIVGGKDLKYTDSIASSIVFISTENDQGHNEICTGTFISSNLILTAAHCIAKDKDGMSVSFRLKDYDTTQNIIDVEIVEAYRLDFSPLKVERNDLGIIQFKGGLPAGATFAVLPQENAFTPTTLSFSAVGYGRNTGITSEDNPMAQTGEGILRIKELTSELFSNSMDNFKIDQFKNKGGLCFGDSGGPALVKDRSSNKNIVIGVASAVLVHRKADYLDASDDCQNESMYSNMTFYTKYLKQYLKLAIEKKEKEKKEKLALKK